MNKTCHSERKVCLTVPCPSHKKLKHFANADAGANSNANADAGGSTTALRGLCPDELKIEPYFL